MDKNRPKPIAGIVLSLLSALLVAGILTFAAPCGPQDHAAVSSCHWAARAVLGCGAAALVLSLVRIFELDEGERRGLDLGIAVCGQLVALMPGGLVALCAAESMRCNTITWPFCMAVGGAIALVGVGDLVRRLLSLRHA